MIVTDFKNMTGCRVDLISTAKKSTDSRRYCGDIVANMLIFTSIGWLAFAFKIVYVDFSLCLFRFKLKVAISSHFGKFFIAEHDPQDSHVFWDFQLQSLTWPETRFVAVKKYDFDALKEKKEKRK